MGQSTGRTESPAAVRHPLDPLSADEFRRAANTLRQAKGFDERWRFAAIELKEPSKEVLASGGKVPREALLVCWNRDDGQAYKAVVSLDEDRVVSWEHRPGEQPNVTVDEYHECDVALRRDPKVVEALAARGVTDMEKVLFDVWAYGGSLIADKYRGRRVGWTDIWYRDHEDSNPYANPVNGLKLIVDLNRAELLEIEDTFAVEKPKIMGEYVPKHVPGTKGARRLETPRDHAARGGLLCPGRQRAQVAEVVHARRVQLPRGARAPHRRLRRRRKDQARGAPDVVLGDGRAIQGSQPRTLPAHGLRRRRVGPRVHDDLAGAGLRLPGRDLLPRRGPPRLHRRALHHQERHLHPRGGRRRPLEARGRDRRGGGAQEPAAGPLLSRDRGELRVPRVLALLPGRQHRVRGAGHRHHGHLPLPRRRAAALRRRSSTIAPTPRSTSTSSSPG